MSVLLEKFSQKYDKILNKTNLLKIEKIVIVFTIFAFLLHLFFVFSLRTFLNDYVFFESFSRNYISTIYTPFTIILIYEVFLLILSLPNSIIESVARQFEIISLIILRNVFKDVANLDNIGSLLNQQEILQNLLVDSTGAVVLFLLIGVYRYSIKFKRKYSKKLDTIRFINLKKVITSFLVLSFITLSVYYFITWILSIIRQERSDIDIFRTYFFENIFTIMIMVDIVLVIISYYYAESYYRIFRNALFIICTIFIRFSITLPKPYDVLISIIAVIFTIIVNYVYVLYIKSDEQDIFQHIKEKE